MESADMVRNGKNRGIHHAPSRPLGKSGVGISWAGLPGSLPCFQLHFPVIQPMARMVLKLLAALMLLAWTTCYARCSAELYGVGEGTMACCQHDQGDGHHSPLDEHTTCGMCQMLATGGVQLAAALLLLFLALLPVVPGLLTFVWKLVLRRQFIPRWRQRPFQRPRPRLAEFLASTACPVRGPAWQMA